MERIGQYWQRKWVHYENKSNEAPETDSQESEDHGVRPTNPNVLSYKKKNIIKVGVYTSCTLEFWAVNMVSNDNDKGAHWPEWLLLC